MHQIAHLTNRALFSVSGPDTRAFLQGLITNDIETIKPGQPIYAALLTPQGKILFDFLIHDGGGLLFLDVAAPQQEALHKRLTLYRLRAKVELGARDDLAVLVRWGDGVIGNDPRHPDLGYRTISPANTAEGAGDYLALRLKLGVPEGADFGQDKIFALDADLDELKGVDFKKGCYVGQELTARMKHRGTARKRLLPLDTLDGSPLPGPDTAVAVEGREVGQIVSVYGARGFALVRLDRLDEAGIATPQASGIAVRIVKPSWLFAP